MKVTDLVVRQLHAEGLSDRRAGDLLGCSGEHFRKRRNQLRLPSNNPRGQYDPEKVYALIEDGFSDAAVGAQLGISPSTIFRVRTARGLKSGVRRLEAKTPQPVDSENQYFPSRLSPKYTAKSDDAFAAALAGRSFSRLAFPLADARKPVHAPHVAPGELSSACGSSLRHDAGSPGMRIGSGRS